MSNEWRIETKAVQSGYTPKAGEPRILPICQTTTYKYDTCHELAELFDLKAAGHMYTRISNPTVASFEAKIAELEGGVGALATSSGQAATLIAIMTICEAGEHILAASNLYGGTYALLKSTLKKFGIEVTFADPNLPKDQLQKCIKENTKAVFAESIGNPGIDVLDFDKFSSLAHENEIPLIVDNTFPTPYLLRPFEHGVDIITHSATKYIDGHATSVGGVIVDSGKFDWTLGKFPGMTEPDETYHGVVYTKDFGDAAYISKARVQLLRDLGSSLSPMNAFLMNLGLETLHLRMERHSENALKIAKWLEQQEEVAWVSYPGLASHPTFERAQKYLPKGCSGVLSFGLKGGRAAGEKFIDSLKLIALVVHVADARSCVLHPASTTHRQLSEAEQLASGVKPELIRFSVGIENCDDLIEDLRQALDQV